jgi:AcrR family transcriptional regulator
MARARASMNGRPAGAPLGRRERRKATTRQELIAAGRRLFGRRGLYESRIEDLADTAGIAKGTFYQYFSGKEDLILAVVEDALARLAESVARGSEGARSLPHGVGLMVAAHVRFFSDHPELVRILHQVRGMLKYNRLGSVPIRRELRAYLSFLERAIGSFPGPGLGPKGRKDLALIVFGGVSGVLSLRVAVRPGRALPRRWPRLAQGYAGLARRHAARRSS